MDGNIRSLSIGKKLVSKNIIRIRQDYKTYFVRDCQNYLMQGIKKKLK